MSAKVETAPAAPYTYEQLEQALDFYKKQLANLLETGEAPA